MIEIKREIIPATAAIPAQPERLGQYTAVRERYEIHWKIGPGGIHCYRPDWSSCAPTSSDFRVFAQMLTEIADQLDAQQPEALNG